jgi:hypothetical protein
MSGAGQSSIDRSSRGRVFAPRVSDEDWEAVRPIITEKFKTDSLVNVINFMESEHGFHAS